MNPIKALLEYLLGASETVTEDTATGYKTYSAQTKPNVLQRLNQKFNPSAPIPTPTGLPQPTSSPMPTATPTPQSAVAGYKTTKPSPTGSYTNKARNPKVEKFQIRDSVVDAINKAAQEYNIPPEILYDIALTESGFNPQAQSNESTAGGLFQFTNPTWEDAMRWKILPQGADKYDPAMNAKAAAYMISQGYLGKWDASKPNWGQFYNEEELQPYYNR